ncbi:hypothetical protein LCGC14_1401650 [marine sediment metagenome]|uniref:Uncharacterized protein n=1 Tax=marine sediment metagenome TaxID=412755 RepID=A0A0F9KHW6_9ZZZZ
MPETQFKLDSTLGSTRRFIMWEMRSLTLWSRLKVVGSMLLAPLTIILIGRSIPVSIKDKD